jgi:hypothetical protein
MEKRFSRYYPFSVAVAACAVAAFLWLCVAKSVFPAFNLSVTIFIYYNKMALQRPDGRAYARWVVPCRL